jgi:hypothetical protein
MIPERSVEAILAEQELLKHLQQEGNTCPYEALRAAIGKDPQGDGYPYVFSARRKIEREKDWVLDVDRTNGIKRLAPREVINRGAKDIKHVKGSLRRAFQRQSTLVPIEKQGRLDAAERTQFLLRLTHISLLRQMLRPSATKRIETAVMDQQKMLPSAEVLKLFTNGKAAKEKE